MTRKRSSSDNKSGSNKFQKTAEYDDHVECPLNPDFSTPEFKECFRSAWISGDEAGESSCTSLTCVSKPFKCFQLKNFFSDEKFLSSLRDEVLQLDVIEKNNDLYQFRQTDSLINMQLTHVQALKRALQGRVANLLRKVSNIQLSDEIDMGCSQYSETDTLLCHDDQLEDRRVAYVIYLTPAWTHEDGGLLQLFNTDDAGRPCTVQQSLLPLYNSMTLFEVSPVSFHQVTEVLSHKLRLSINGWFHAPPSSPPPQPPLPASVTLSASCRICHIKQGVLFDWLNPIYLTEEIQADIRRQFARRSEIELAKFLRPAKYRQLRRSLRSENLRWTNQGPADRRRVDSLFRSADADADVADWSTAAGGRSQAGGKAGRVVREARLLFSSQAMLLVLSQLTGLRLHPMFSCDNSSDHDSTSNSSTDDEDGEQVNDPVATGSSSSALSGAETSTETTSSTVDDNSTDEADETDVLLEPTQHQSVVTDDTTELPLCDCDVLRWTQGCYTLVSDMLTSSARAALDARLCIDCEHWHSLQDLSPGGATSYIARNEDEELLCMHPVANRLCLVYRDTDTVKFTKYVNSRAKSIKPFYDITCTYHELPDQQ